MTSPRAGASARAATVIVAVAALALAGVGCSTTGGDGASGTVPATGAPATDSPATSAPGTSAPAAGTTSTTKPLVATYGPKACALLTVEEITPVLGFTPERVATTPANFLAGGYTSACDFRHPDDPGRQGKTVRVLVFPPDTPLAGAKQSLTDVADVPGLGVPAFAGRAPESSGSGPNTIVLDVPGQGFSITVVTGGDRTVAELVDLAQKALPRFLALPRGSSTTPSP